MSRRIPKAPAVFAALGDETRLSILVRLSQGRRSSISQLTEGTKLTRQAVTKHLLVLEKAGVVHRTRAGRECVFEFDPRPLTAARSYLDQISQQWDAALDRLKSYVEQPSGFRAAR